MTLNNFQKFKSKIEYEFITTISKLTRDKKQRIAFLKGHGELNENEVADISYSVLSDGYSLSEYYEVEHFDISEFELDSISNKPNLARQLQRLNAYKAIVIAKCGMPCKKLFVPSIGSIIQKLFLSSLILFSLSSQIIE